MFSNIAVNDAVIVVHKDKIILADKYQIVWVTEVGEHNFAVTNINQSDVAYSKIIGEPTTHSPTMIASLDMLQKRYQKHIIDTLVSPFEVEQFNFYRSRNQ